MLNRALQEGYDWCGGNQLTPHPGKSEAMLLCAGNPMGPIAPVFLGDSSMKWVTKARVLGNKLTWDAQQQQQHSSVFFVQQKCAIAALQIARELIVVGQAKYITSFTKQVIL